MTKPKKRAPEKPRPLMFDKSQFAFIGTTFADYEIVIEHNLHFYPDYAEHLADWLTKAAAWCRWKNGKGKP